MGEFCEVLHLPPDAVKQLTAHEFDALVDFLDARRNELKKAAASNG